MTSGAAADNAFLMNYLYLALFVFELLRLGLYYEKYLITFFGQPEELSEIK